MPTERSKRMPPFLVMDILETAQSLEKQGKKIIHLEIGEPDFDTPDIIKQAAAEAILRGETGYTHSQGLYELRAEIASYYYSTYNVELLPEQVVITSGSSPAIFLALSALLEKGDEVIITDPSYACYKNVIEFCGGVPVSIPIHDSEGYQLKKETLLDRLGKKTKAIFINSPANPTGTTLTRKTIKELSELCQERKIYLLSDEIYHGLVYEGEEVSALEYGKNFFVFNGFSKAYAMTGWRLGYLIAPIEFLRPIQKMQQNLFICATSFVQRAGVIALREGKSLVAKMRLEYNRRRKYIVPELRKLGFRVETFPQGAFYVLADARKFTDNSYEFAMELLKKSGVAVAPGIDFGKNAEGFMRFSYATSIDNIKEGIKRLETYLEKRV